MTFNVAACRRFAAFALEHEPPEHVTRPEPKGLQVVRFVLPLNLCPTLNALAEMPSWKRARLKGELLLRMRTQMPARLPMIPGRAWARAVRFSSVEPDADSAGAKLAVDRLTGKNDGLGLIQDDKPSVFELHQWWEPAPKGAGFLLLDVFTGRVRP